MNDYPDSHLCIDPEEAELAGYDWRDFRHLEFGFISCARDWLEKDVQCFDETETRGWYNNN